MHTASDILTFKSGYMGTSNGVYAGLVKSIAFKITPSAQLSKGVAYVVATLSSSFKPNIGVGSMAIKGTETVYAEINDSTGEVSVLALTNNIPASTNIWFRCSYI